MGSGDYYDVLGVPRSADEKEIQKAYRNLARKSTRMSARIREPKKSLSR